jgi:hypothetical protein
MAFVIGILLLMIAATTIIGATWLALTDRASAPPMRGERPGGRRPTALARAVVRRDFRWASAGHEMEPP